MSAFARRLSRALILSGAAAKDLNLWLTVYGRRLAEEPSAVDRRQGAYVQFEVKDQSYLLNYVPAQGWVLIAATPGGVRVLPVVNDDQVESFRHLMLDEEQDENKPTN